MYPPVQWTYLVSIHKILVGTGHRTNATRSFTVYKTAADSEVDGRRYKVQIREIQ